MEIELIINTLNEVIPLKNCENNKKVWISTICPFCKNQGKRPFRLQTKLKVGKSYCCGASFKTYKKLIQELNRANKDKIDVLRVSSFEKCNIIDDELPF